MCKCIIISVLYARHPAAVGQAYYGICYWKLFAASSFHLHLYFHSSAAQTATETVGLTVASLQRCFNGTPMPASPGTRRAAVAAGYRGPAGCRSDPLCEKPSSLSSRQEEIRLCELSISGMAVTSAACVCRRSGKMIVSSAQKHPERKTVSPAITDSEVSIWHILPIRTLLQLNTSALESPSSIFDAISCQALNTAHQVIISDAQPLNWSLTWHWSSAFIKAYPTTLCLCSIRPEGRREFTAPKHTCGLDQKHIPQ